MVAQGGVKGKIERIFDKKWFKKTNFPGEKWYLKMVFAWLQLRAFVLQSVIILP